MGDETNNVMNLVPSKLGSPAKLFQLPKNTMKKTCTQFISSIIRPVFGRGNFL